MIRFIAALMFFAALLGSAALPARADVRDVYTVRDISVDQKAASIVEARESAMSSARVAGARALFARITLPEDRAAAGGLAVDAALAARLAAAVDVQEETAGAGRYRGKLAVVFNPASVRAYLKSLNVAYIDTQAPLTLLAPVSANAALAPGWRAAFGSANNYALSPFVVATGGYAAASDWTALSAEVSGVNARRGALAELEGRDGAYRVKVSTVTASGTELVGTTATVPTLEAATRAASAALDDAWKKSSIVRETARTAAQAEVLYTSLSEWNTLRGALAKSPLVSELKIRAIAREGAIVSFTYAGDLARLRSELSQRGLSVGEGDGMLRLRSAVSAAGTP
jgi:hypothetical protein